MQSGMLSAHERIFIQNFRSMQRYAKLESVHTCLSRMRLRRGSRAKGRLQLPQRTECWMSNNSTCIVISVIQCHGLILVTKCNKYLYELITRINLARTRVKRLPSVRNPFGREIERQMGLEGWKDEI